MDANTRARMIWSLWLITWIGLLLGYHDRLFWEVVVAISAAQALVVTALVRFRPLAFPAQLRIAYTGLVALGTYVPELEGLMYMTTLGLAALLAFGYCPLARALYLLPWNRTHALTPRIALRVFVARPRPGRFALQTSRPS